VDTLYGLKENVIIGKLIPAGTGMARYRDILTSAPDYEPLPFYSSDSDLDGDLDLAAWLADTSAGSFDQSPPELGIVGTEGETETPGADFGAADQQGAAGA